ncbi:MAG: GyrI-like domain-containing protein [Pirellulales bacterium]|nr:GyrI-like domain-containing protein [Pirellulales bacterium]
MSFNCELKELAAGPALSIRTRAAVGDLPRVLGEGYAAIAQYLGELNEVPAGPPFAVYYNMDMQDLDIEFGFPVLKCLGGRGDIRPGETPGGRVATCLHVGPYSDVEPAYNALMQWIKNNGHEMTGVAYERYLNDPDHTPPEELMTQIAMMLRG